MILVPKSATEFGDVATCSRVMKIRSLGVDDLIWTFDSKKPARLVQNFVFFEISCVWEFIKIFKHDFQTRSLGGGHIKQIYGKMAGDSHSMFGNLPAREAASSARQLLYHNKLISINVFLLSFEFYLSI